MWQELGETEEQRVRTLVELLVTSKTGKLLLEKARNRAASQGKILFDVIIPGEISITDTTLVRRFSPERPEAMAFELHSKIYINKDLKVRDAILDLAHELVHYIYKTPFNPYQDEFKADEFVTSTLEGRGGEIDAFLAECQVEKELFPTRNRDGSNCKLVFDEEGQVSRHLAVKEFYKVGPFLSQMQKDLQKFLIDSTKFGYLKEEQATFISSAYGLPYPLAALREYEVIMTKVCENDYKRLSFMKQSIGEGLGRQLASSLEEDHVTDQMASGVRPSEQPEGNTKKMGHRAQEFDRMAQSFNRRCQYFSARSGRK